MKKRTKIILKKRINDNETMFSTLYFNSVTKTIINQRYHLHDSFEEILNLLDIWINESTGWSIDEIQGLYINILIHLNMNHYQAVVISNYQKY